MYLLAADIHLTDNPRDEYRWEALERIREQVSFRSGIKRVYILGDLCDRADRHSGVLVNRLVKALQRIVAASDSLEGVTILMGNHEFPTGVPPYWRFLNDIDGIDFVSEPEYEAESGILLLPFSPTPAATWYPVVKQHPHPRMIFMHQPVDGAIGESGVQMRVPPERAIPDAWRGVSIISGDIHTPQVTGGVRYVGAPHPIDFGDDYTCRMLLLFPNLQDIEEIRTDPIKKAMVQVESVEDLLRNTYKLQQGDQARVRFTMRDGDLRKWAPIEFKIREWAASLGILLASIEPTIVRQSSDVATAPSADFYTHPPTALDEFAAHEGISDPVLIAGQEFLATASKT